MAAATAAVAAMRRVQAWGGELNVARGDLMPAMFDVVQGQEIFYRYGEYTNAELLALYGFVVPTDLRP